MEGAVLREASMLRLGLLTELIALLVLSACNPSGSPMAAGDGAIRPAVIAGAQRTLVILGRLEPPSLAAKPFAAVSLTALGQVRAFNATLDYNDEVEVSHPYLAEALPELNTDSWRIFPDGRMETTYQLRPGLTWHDGH